MIHHSVEFSAAGYDDQGSIVVCTKEYWEGLQARILKLEANQKPTHRGCGPDCSLPAGHLDNHHNPDTCMGGMSCPYCGGSAF